MSRDEQQERFYRELYRQHGDDPRALSYRDRPTQRERFARLCRVLPPPPTPCTVHEIGCGLGHLGEYLAEHHPQAVYSGSDIVPEFVAACRKKFPAAQFHLRNVLAELPAECYDHVLLSGTFNARLDAGEDEWRELIAAMLRAMYALCRDSLAANFLTSHHDPAYAQPHLHYQPPGELIERVVGELSRHYELDAAGPLFELTLRVHRPEAVARRYPGPEFARYFRSPR